MSPHDLARLEAPVRALAEMREAFEDLRCRVACWPDVPEHLRKEFAAGLEDEIANIEHAMGIAAEDACDDLPALSEDPDARDIEGVRETLATIARLVPPSAADKRFDALAAWERAGCDTRHPDYEALRALAREDVG